MKNVILISAMALSLAACSSNPITGETKIKVGKGSDTVPTWYLKTPNDEDNVVYTAATGLSEDMQFSLDKAMHEAKVTLGDKIATKVTSNVVRTVSDSNAEGGTIRKTEKNSNSGFVDIDVAGYVVEKKKIYLEDGKYRTYVLVSLSR